MSFRRAASLDAIWEGETLAVGIDGRRVLLVHHEEGLCAYEDRCAHLGVPLSTSALDGHHLACSAHGYRYDMRSGRCENPKDVRLVRFPLKVEAGEILIDVSAAEGAP